MKTIKTILLSIVVLLVFAPVKAQNTAAVGTSINQVITSYIDLKNTLFTGDAIAAAAKAKIFNGQIAAISTKNMPADQQGVWKNNVDKLSFDSRHISEVTAIDHQREHFASLSKNLYSVLKTFKVNSQVIYWQYCPMKKASWLSETAAIKNPYYGKSMADCGKTTATLKAN